MNSWQLPISSASPTYARVAHWVHMTPRTTKLWPTACGRMVNPGFASPGRGLIKCAVCRSRASET